MTARRTITLPEVPITLPEVSITLPTAALPAATTHPLMAALGRGLPITLLIDLIDPNGPRSQEMLRRERKTADVDVISICEPADALRA